jgi:hypothetical protein
MLIKKHAPKFTPNIEQAFQEYEKIYTAITCHRKGDNSAGYRRNHRLSKAIQPKLSELHNRARRSLVN